MTREELRQKAIAGCNKVAGMSRWFVSADDKRLAEAAGKVVSRPIADPVLEAVIAEYDQIFARGASVPTIPDNTDWPRVGKWVWGGAVTLVAVAALALAIHWQPKPGPIPSPVVPPADIAIVGEMRGPVGWPIDLTVETTGGQVSFVEPDDPHFWVRQRSADGKDISVGADVKGRYRLIVHACVGGKSVADSRCVEVGGTVPIPPGPEPPTPVPPVPQGFRAVLVYESSANNTKEQLAVLYSPKVQEYLDRKTTDGKNGWRRWDQNIDNKYAPTALKTIVESAKPKLTQLPALVIATDGKIDVYPMAAKATEDEALSLLKKYGGE